MSLREFLNGKVGTDDELLKMARNEKTISGQLIHRDTLNGWLAEKKIYVRFKDIAETPAHPFRDAVAAIIDSVEFNFIQGSATGDNHIALMDALISFEPTVSDQLADLRPRIISRANVESDRFPNVTLHDVKSATDTIKRKAVTQVDGILTINTTADCENHNPQVYQYIASADFYKRVAGFRGISVAGKYQIEVPRVNNLFVDNAYGVVS